MQSHPDELYPPVFEARDEFGRKMQPSRGCSNRTGIRSEKRLVIIVIARIRSAFSGDIWR